MPFHRRGRNGKRQLLRLLPRGSCRAATEGLLIGGAGKTVKRSSRRTGVNLQFFPVQPSALGLKGASSPFFVAPARRNRCDLAVLNAQHLLRKPVCALKAPLGLSCLAGTAALFFSFGVKREHFRPYFPTQNRSNTCSMTASEAFSPVRSQRASSASSTQTETASSPKPPAAASSAPATASRARRAAESCR